MTAILKSTSLMILSALVTPLSALAAPTVGPLKASPSQIQAGATTSTTVTVQITDQTVLPNGVNLLQVDESGKTLSTLGVMHDNGQNGGQSASDGTFTLIVPFTPTQAGAINLQASAAFKGLLQRVKSPIYSVIVTGGTTAITGFTPASGPFGILVTVSLSNFSPPASTVPQVMMAGQSGGTISAPVATSTATSVSFVVPTGAGTGSFAISIGSQTASTTSPFTVTTSSTFALTAAPATATLLPGQTVTYAVTLNSFNSFDGLASLAVTGSPIGVQASFNPAEATAGQISILTLTAPRGQVVSSTQLMITAAASIEGQAVSKSANVTLQISGVTTSFLGRTVVDDDRETPIAGVTVKFLGKDNSGGGSSTGCTGQTVSDAAGNFLLSNLDAIKCNGPS